MLKMRLQRVGRRNHATYRVVVVESTQGPKSGKYIDLLGSYDPHTNTVQIDGEKAKEWIGKGVQVSPTMHNILVGEKVIEGKKVNVLPRKSPIVSETEETEEPAPESESTAEDTEEAKEESAEEVVAEETPQEEEAKA